MGLDHLVRIDMSLPISGGLSTLVCEAVISVMEELKLHEAKGGFEVMIGRGKSLFVADFCHEGAEDTYR